MIRHLATFGFAVLAATSLGCKSEPPSGTVKGTVTVKGSPFSNASVTILDMKSGNGGSVDIDSTGAFAFPDPLPLGKYTLYFAPKSTQASPDKPTPFTPDKSIPQKYWSASSSDLSYNVEQGENTFAVTIDK